MTDGGLEALMVWHRETPTRMRRWARRAALLIMAAAGLLVLFAPQEWLP